MDEEVQITKKQHLIPQLIQKEFSEDKLKVYGIKEIAIKKDNKIEKIKYDIKNYSIKNIMCKNSCYEFDKLNISKLNEPNALEKILGNYETQYKSILENIKKMIKEKKSFKQLKKYIESTAMMYFIIFYLRTYQFILYPNSKNIEQQEQVFLNLKNKLFDSEYIISMAKTIINNYNLHILESPKGNFLLSDSYFSTASLDYKGFYPELSYVSNRDIGLKNIIILIPISANYYIMYTDSNAYKNNYIKVYDKDIIFYNSIIYRNSYEYTIGKNKEMLEFINKNVPKYMFYSYSCGGYNKRELWSDINIDKQYYLGNSEGLNPKGFKLYSNKNGNFFIEKPLALYDKSLNGLKFISINPNYDKKEQK